MCAAAGVARAADAPGIDFGPRKQIIERADAVPNGVLRDVGPGEQALRSNDGVLDGRGLELGIVPIFVIHLHALTLAEGVPCESDEAAPCQSGEAALPCLVRLGAVLVSQWKQDRRIRGLAAGRQIKIRRDVESGAALEDDLLDAEIAAVECADYARIQRRALGPCAQVTPHTIAPVLPARRQIGHGGNARDGTLPLVKQSTGFVLEIRGQHAVHIAENRGIGEKIPIVAGLCKGSRRGQQDREKSE